MLRQRFPVLFCSLIVLMLAGCGGEESGTANGEQSVAGDKDEAVSAETIAAEMAKLSDEDRTAAMAQKVCPVAGGPLGGMGVPIKVELADGKSAFVCCAGCADPLREDSEKYLAKFETSSEETK